MNINKFEKNLKHSLKANFPKWVTFNGLILGSMEFYLTIPLDKRLNEKEFFKINKDLKKWAGKFGYEEYGSGTGGDVYDIHFGPKQKLANDRMKRIKKALKHAIDAAESLEDLDEIVILTDKLGLLDAEEDLDWNIPANASF